MSQDFDQEDMSGRIRNFPCMYCGVRFPHQSKLTRHILSHSLETLKFREQSHPQMVHPVLGLESMNFMDNHYSTFPQKFEAFEQPSDGSSDVDFTASFQIGGDGCQTNSVLCKFCGKSFPEVGSLIAHLPVHTGDRPFKCEYCGKAFKLRHHMKDHCRVHTGERPFRCSICGKTFSRSTILKAHEKTHYPKFVPKFVASTSIDHIDDTGTAPAIIRKFSPSAIDPYPEAGSSHSQ
ncbi:zinc finger protein, putative [Pediculus humanus corporis]|uniref:Zinc finger protein, putative n=1 Tax=Pediculus humanus subsp. corporis TaxID=121224 RepID=E0VKU1_PEDHC|nr:zinc finger protein, putative [Pediculus humanus corporis]EEB13997.1 zinc finger protein, putative [Pediculus humanus corporis]